MTVSLRRWGKRNLRSFPWRKPGYKPFEILITEVLLTRTRAEAVAQVAPRILSAYPSPASLNCAQPERLEALVRPLGLYKKRGSALRRLSGDLMANHGGHVPRDSASLQGLPGVGRYAANATACFAFKARVPIVDSNVARVLRRYFRLRPPQSRLATDAEYWNRAARILPKSRDVRLHNWSLLDLGALICKPRNPDCEVCPLSEKCSMRQEFA